MTIDQIPPFRGPRPPGSSKARRGVPRQPFRLTRRRFIGAALGTGMALGLSTLTIFPSVRRAYAVHGTQGYQIRTAECTSGMDFNCRPGCGPTRRVRRSFCVTDSQQHTYGFHKNNRRRWKLRPDQCLKDTNFDGWLWQHLPTTSCEGCYNSITFRCHDGKRCNNQGRNCVNTVCRWRTACS